MGPRGPHELGHGVAGVVAILHLAESRGRHVENVVGGVEFYGFDFLSAIPRPPLLFKAANEGAGRGLKRFCFHIHIIRRRSRQQRPPGGKP